MNLAKYIVLTKNKKEVLSLQEIELESKIKYFTEKIDGADLIKIDDSPFLEYWEVYLDEPYDFISTQWSDEDGIYTYGLNYSDIKNIIFKKGHWNIFTHDSKHPTSIRLYKISTIEAEVA